MNNVQIRRAILESLYEMYNRDPHKAIEFGELMKKLNLPSTVVRSNLEYLCAPDKKLAQMKKTSVSGGGVYYFAQITAAGIDLVDDPNEFNARFLPQVTYQYVAGDHVQVEIGDNATDVIVGKDIVKLQFGLNHGFEEVCRSFTELLVNRACQGTDVVEVSMYLDRLRVLLTSKEIDLGEVQRIKRFLLEQEGPPAVGTSALFSHPTVVEPIQQAVERLIGRS